jgi:hypothetical protein
LWRLPALCIPDNILSKRFCRESNQELESEKKNDQRNEVKKN